MPNFRRYYVPNAIYFITTVVHGRHFLFNDDAHVQLLWDNLRQTRAFHPFCLWAYAFLPDHLHLLIQPKEGASISKILNSFKSNFTKDYKAHHGITKSLSLWQSRFWDHIIRDADDLEHHFDYIHYNPVKHGWVERPEIWPHTSYRHWLERGYYEVGWGWSEPVILSHQPLECGEPP